MTTAQTYYEIASDLANTAPAQAKLLRHLLMQDEMESKERICEKLDISGHNFPTLIGKLRDRGVEVVSKRIQDADDPQHITHVYGVVTTEVENWSHDRRKAVLTAWGRTTKVFERHLFALDLPHSEIYKILGVMEYVTKTLKDINLDVSLKAEAAAMEAQAIAAKKTVPA